MMKYLSASAFLLFVFCTFCKGQVTIDLTENDIKYETQYVPLSTVPNGITRNIRQDRKGNLWIAAFDGVFRYDGKSFSNITSKVSSARFFSVLEDSKGNFWFGSIGSGVFYYDGTSFQHFTTQEGLADDAVPSIYEDKSGNIWFSTVNGVSRYDPSASLRAGGKSFQNFRLDGGLPYDNDVNSIVEDKTGKFWFGTRGNAFIYDGKKFTALTHNGKPFINVRTIMKDKKGNIWLAGQCGLWRYDGSTFTNFTQNFVGYVYEDKHGNLWTSSQIHNSRMWALSRYDAKSLSTAKPTVTEIESEYEDNAGMIFGILEANDGSIWFGALKGLYRYDGKNTVTHFKGKVVQE